MNGSKHFQTFIGSKFGTIPAGGRFEASYQPSKILGRCGIEMFYVVSDINGTKNNLFDLMNPVEHVSMRHCLMAGIDPRNIALSSHTPGHFFFILLNI